jgi:hypothetical protein
MKETIVECSNHGPGKPAFVCSHLTNSSQVGFHLGLPSEEDIQDGDNSLCGWCDECEKVRLREGGWNEVAEDFAGVKCVCEKCFFEIKARNEGMQT